MPTEKKRVAIEADNLPANLIVEESCPAVYTAQGLFDKRPGDYAKLVQMLTDGIPVTRIKKELKVSHNTIAVVRSREKEVIEASKKVMRGLIGHASQLAVEKMIEQEARHHRQENDPGDTPEHFHSIDWDMLARQSRHQQWRDKRCKDC